MMINAHILVVEDDAELQRLLSHRLKHSGWKVSLAKCGQEADAILAARSIDLIILDIMLPGEDGLSICRRVRNMSTVPILILSAKGDDVDRVVGLEIGADDYMSKPFNPRELEARIRAMLRRSQMAASNKITRSELLQFSHFTLKVRKRELIRDDGVQIHLTPAEFELLRVFCERPGMALSREQLLDLTHGRNNNSADRSVDILVSRLRRKVEQHMASGEKLIQTIRSGGYEFIVTVHEARQEDLAV